MQPTDLWRPVFEDRNATLRIRQATALFLFLVADLFHQGLIPILLFVLLIGQSVFESWLTRRFFSSTKDLDLQTSDLDISDRPLTSPLAELGFQACILISGSASSAFALYFWLYGGTYGEMLAVVEWCAAFIQGVVALRGAGRLMWIAVASSAWPLALAPFVTAYAATSQSPAIVAPLSIIALGLALAQLGQLIAKTASERKTLLRTQQAAELDRAFTNSIIENVPNLLFVLDAKTRKHVLVNKAAELISGKRREDVVGTSYEGFHPVSDIDQLRRLDDEALATQAPVTFEEQKIMGRDGQAHVLRGRRVSVCDDTGEPRYIIGLAEDVTEIREAEAQVRRLAHYDSLTELPNRVLFRNRLYDAFNDALAGVDTSALLWIDLDFFKEVNDTLGHLVGDHLLMSVAERLQSTVRDHDTVARLGGDEFAIVQRSVARREDAMQLAQRIVNLLSEPFHLSGRDVKIGASVGIAFAPEDGQTIDELMMHADMALYRCKENGRGGYLVFDPSMDERRRARRALEKDLRSAFTNGEFSLSYQPQLNLASGRLSGCEALLRWSQSGRLISPVEFIPVAEDIGLICELGEWVLHQACAEAARWPSPMKVAVNISPAQFKDPNLIRTVIAALAHSGLSPERLEVEITESTLLQSSQANLHTLFRLRELGVSVALDDFGTGFSSLNYLRQFPFTKIKIDQSFVSDLSMSAESVSIVRAIAGMASYLGMQTTAEGVETERQLEMAREHGCTEIQGYLIARPTPAEALPDLFEFYGSALPKSVPTGEAELWLQAG